MAYAQHQSFYLRDKWVSKGLKFLVKDSNFFHDKEAFEKIGLGKNMVQSLKFWLLAMELIQEEKNSKSHIITPLGKLIFHYDRLILSKDTAAILHYHLIRNRDNKATAFSWFFNNFNETLFTRESVEESLDTWVQKEEKKPVSLRSLKRDVDCLIQLYTKDINEKDPEDGIYSPMTKLNLLSISKKSIRKNHPSAIEIGSTALYYVLLSYAEENGVNTISIDEIINEQMLWGKLFNLTRGEIIEVLNSLTTHPIYPLTYTRTNNLDNVKIPENISSHEILKYEYENKGGIKG